ncbi:hypothetical protein [Amycolatopsis anabasis]|uniref:hypothetical protein n=1 Tax=Amycolatopsis anabasis TaxID=1840409 RepID=UPI00131DA0F0|nr:hypothetical protein [Amycolatopsis anabasis]
MTKRLLRKAGLVAAGAAALVATSAIPASAAEPVPAFDFADCPKTLPAGADPAKWRCEVLISDGTLSFGTVRDLRLNRMRLTFAEGRLNGEYAQVFGALRAEPTRVPGTFGGTLELRYAGYSDFQSNDQRKGEIDLKGSLRGPLLARGCAIGGDDDPIHSVIQQVGGLETHPDDPSVHVFHTVDRQLNIPSARGCGPLTRPLNHRLGLPSPSGTNVLTQTTYVKLRSYG